MLVLILSPQKKPLIKNGQEKSRELHRFPGS